LTANIQFQLRTALNLEITQIIIETKYAILHTGRGKQILQSKI